MNGDRCASYIFLRVASRCTSLMSALLPKADKQFDASGCPLSAKSGHSHCSKIFLFDHIVGEREHI